MEEQPSSDQQPEKLRDTIIRRALEAFVHGGYSRTSTDTISRMLGISKKTLYRVFPSKEDILRSVVRMATRSIEERTSVIYNDHSASVADRLSALVSQISPIYARIRSPQLLLDFQRAAPSVWDELRQWRMERYRALRGLIQEGIDSGELRSDVSVDDIVTVYAVLVDKCMDFATLEESSVSSVQLYQGLMDLLLRGIYNDGHSHDAMLHNIGPCERSPILTTSLSLFNQFGYSKTSSDQIARELGISKRTLYEQVSKKSHIAINLVVGTAREVDRRCDPLVFDDAATFTTNLHTLLTTYTRMLFDLTPTFLDDIAVALPRLHRAFITWRRGSIEYHLSRAFGDGKTIGVVKTSIDTAVLIALVRLLLEHVLIPKTSLQPGDRRAVESHVVFTMLYDGILQRTVQSPQPPMH